MDKLEQLKEAIEGYIEAGTITDSPIFINSLKEITEMVGRTPDAINELQKESLISLAYEFFDILEINKTDFRFSDREVISTIEEFIDAVFDMEDRESETVQEILTASIMSILRSRRKA